MIADRLMKMFVAGGDIDTLYLCSGTMLHVLLIISSIFVWLTRANPTENSRFKKIMQKSCQKNVSEKVSWKAIFG